MNVGLLAPRDPGAPAPSHRRARAFVDRLAGGLTAAGHDVRLRTVDDRPARPAGPADRAGEWFADCDVVHDHTIGGPAWALAHPRPGVVSTCHGWLDGELHDLFRMYADRLPVVGISCDQAFRAPDLPLAGVIHEGVDPAAFPVGLGDGGYLLFVGQMMPERGMSEAIRVAQLAGRPLLVAAAMRGRRERAYFDACIEPLLGGDIEYVGEVGDSDRIALLASARALLNPVPRGEPFDLLMIEALACGTPVVTCPADAAPEIVDDGVTGFLCAAGPLLVEAVDRIGELDRSACRAVVRDWFSIERMVAEHLALYGGLLADT